MVWLLKVDLKVLTGLLHREASQCCMLLPPSEGECVHQSDPVGEKCNSCTVVTLAGWLTLVCKCLTLCQAMNEVSVIHLKQRKKTRKKTNERMSTDILFVFHAIINYSKVMETHDSCTHDSSSLFLEIGHTWSIYVFSQRYPLRTSPTDREKQLRLRYITRPCIWNIKSKGISEMSNFGVNY